MNKKVNTNNKKNLKKFGPKFNGIILSPEDFSLVFHRPLNILNNNLHEIRFKFMYKSRFYNSESLMLHLRVNVWFGVKTVAEYVLQSRKY